MTYIENIYLCLALPLLLSLFFIRGRSRRYALFLVIGMTVCLLSAYVSSFFMGYYGADGTTAAIEITPVCEEGMKLLPLLFFYLIFEPAPQELPAAAIALAAGFATFENVCYLTENGAADFRFLLIRGIAAGALHILCGVLSGFGVGGGTLLLVYMTAFAGVDQHLAQGINLLYFLPAGLMALPAHVKNGYIEKPVLLPAIGAGLVCAALAAWAATAMEVGLLRKFFGAFLIVVGLMELFGRTKE